MRGRADVCVVVQAMVDVGQRGPLQSFVLDGQASGLELPRGLPSWAAQQQRRGLKAPQQLQPALTVCHWLYLDAPPCHGTCGDPAPTAKTYQPVVFSLLDDDGRSQSKPCCPCLRILTRCCFHDECGRGGPGGLSGAQPAAT